MFYPKSCIKKSAPYWFHQSKSIMAVSGFTKDFNTLGLKDFRTTAKLSSSHNIKDVLSDITDHMDDAAEPSYNYNYIANMANFSIKHILDQLNLTPDNIQKTDIKDDRDLVIVKKGTSLQKIVDDLLFRSKKSNLLKQDLLDLKSAFTSSKSHKVVFSTNPWDILTMSMRGISSCMAWLSSHSRQLIGSCLDPYCGVIYATDGEKTRYGEKMLYRSVVRLVKKTKKGKFHLYVEGAYPKLTTENEEGDDKDLAATEMFRSALIAKIKDNRKIGSVVEYNSSYGYYIPVTEAIREVDERSCIDSDLEYRKEQYD